MSVTPTLSTLVASPRPNTDAPMPWHPTVAVDMCPNASTGHQTTTGFSGIVESKRLHPGSFAGGLT